MSKIRIKSELKSSKGFHKFEGKGIKSGNKIIYIDDGILTIIVLDDIVYLERKKNYYIKLGFYASKTLKGTYIIPEGKMQIETITEKLEQKGNNLYIKYKMRINTTYIDNFELNLHYSIDT